MSAAQTVLSKARQLKTMLTKTLELGVTVAVGVLVVNVVCGILTRYLFGEQAKWTGELACFMLIWISLLGGALAFGTKGHLGVDYFVGLLHPSARKLMGIVTHLLVLFFAVSIFIYGGLHVVRETLSLGQVTPALGWQMGYVYLALPIAGCFMVLYTLEHLLEDIQTPADQLHEDQAAGDLD